MHVTRATSIVGRPRVALACVSSDIKNATHRWELLACSQTPPRPVVGRGRDRPHAARVRCRDSVLYLGPTSAMTTSRLSRTQREVASCSRCDAVAWRSPGLPPATARRTIAESFTGICRLTPVSRSGAAGIVSRDESRWSECCGTAWPARAEISRRTPTECERNVPAIDPNPVKAANAEPVERLAVGKRHCRDQPHCDDCCANVLADLHAAMYPVLRAVREERRRGYVRPWRPARRS